MNYHLACSSTLLCSFLVTGCSTHAIKQTNEVSTTAIVYTDTLNKLLEITKGRVIEMDSWILSMSHTGKNKAQKLNEKNDAVENWISVADQLRDQNILLQEYFKALQAMVDSPLRNDMSKTLGSVSFTISEINATQSLRYGVGEPSSELGGNQVGLVSELSSIVIGRHYAGQVKQALERDKEIIGRQIDLQAKQLALISNIYKRRLKMENQSHYADKVLGPFVSKSPNNQFHVDEWANNRLKWFNRKEALDIFEDVQEANEAFREAWVNILQGKQDIGVASAMLSDVNRFIRQAYKLNDSIKNPQPLYPGVPPQIYVREENY